MVLNGKKLFISFSKTKCNRWKINDAHKTKKNVIMINFSYLLLCHPVAKLKCEYYIIVTLVMKHHNLFENKDI